MTPSEPELRRSVWWKRKWVTLSEIVAVAALSVAVLGFLDNHRQHALAQAEKSQAVHKDVLVLTGQPVDDGERLVLKPMREAQAVQSQRYLFPRPVLDHPMEVSAAEPQIQSVWVRDGLRRELEAAAKAQGRKPLGSGRLPVGVVTTYVEDGETRTDRALYAVGFKAVPGGLFAGGPHVILQGLELLQRGVGPDLQARTDARWARSAKLD